MQESMRRWRGCIKLLSNDRNDGRSTKSLNVTKFGAIESVMFMAAH